MLFKTNALGARVPICFKYCKAGHLRDKCPNPHWKEGNEIGATVCNLVATQEEEETIGNNNSVSILNTTTTTSMSDSEYELFLQVVHDYYNNNRQR